jgi:hypothetical protein
MIADYRISNGYKYNTPQLDAYNKLKEDGKKEQEKTKKLEEELKQKQRKLKIKED